LQITVCKFFDGTYVSELLDALQKIFRAWWTL